MATKMMSFAILLLLVPVPVLMESSDSVGCSIKGSECTYNIKLGQCNGQPQIATSDTSSCCNSMTSKYAQLEDDMEDMKLKVDFLVKQNSSKETASRAELEEALRERNDVLAVLRRKEEKLKGTEDELARTIDTATKEIGSLRDNLAKMHDFVTTCRLHMEQKVVPTTPRPRVEVAPSNYSTTYCSFNNNMCGFRTKEADAFILVVKMNKGSSLETGPRVEHSLGISSGYYLGLYSQYTALNRYDASGKDVSARLLSKPFPPANAYCIMFWYYMRGADIRTLSVNLETSDGNGYTIFSESGPSKTDEWQLAKVDVAPEYASEGFKIGLNMTTNAFYKFKAGIQHLYNQHGDIAVDDLYVMDTACDSVFSYPDGAFIYRGANVTSYYTFYTTPMNWFDAFYTCRGSGPLSALVSIDSYSEQEFLAKTIQEKNKLHEAGTDGYYTSGTDLDMEGSFVWTNTGISRPIGEGSWKRGQPDNEGGNQDCLLMEYPNSAYEWGDVDCKSKHPFICEATYPNEEN